MANPGHYYWHRTLCQWFHETEFPETETMREIAAHPEALHTVVAKSVAATPPWNLTQQVPANAAASAPDSESQQFQSMALLTASMDTISDWRSHDSAS